MSREKLGQRLEKLSGALSDESLLANRGIGNEIGFHIFAYDPSLEVMVTDYLPKLKEELRAAGIKVVEFDLYKLMLKLLKERDLLDKTFKLEKKKGSDSLRNALKKVVRPERIAEHIQTHLEDPADLVFITGVGAAYPVLRSHVILNNLHSAVEQPLVMFFPGTYDGQELRLFNELRDDNYYRAFQLLP